MKAALLQDRGVVALAGADARSFLNGLLTSDVGSLVSGQAKYGALLTPQGKVLVDALVTAMPDDSGGSLLIDAPRALAATLAERLRFYKLRAKVTIEDRSDQLCVLALWDGAPGGDTDAGVLFADPRLPTLGHRIILPLALAGETAAALGATLVDAMDYESHRIALGVPRGGLDFVYGDAFPHEADMDQLGGVDFTKGCYVGQEVVSRTEHRGTARTRVVAIDVADHAPEAGLPITAGDKIVGTTGSSAGVTALALLRLDRYADALAAGLPLIAGGIALRPRRQTWAHFAFPEPT